VENAATLLPVTPVSGVVAALLLLVATAVAGAANLGHGRAVVLAGVRAAVQLVAVSFVLTHVVDRLGFAGLFVVMMYTVAALTAAGRLTGNRRPLWPGVPIVMSTAPTLVLLWATGLLPPKGIVLIPDRGHSDRRCDHGDGTRGASGAGRTDAASQRGESGSDLGFHRPRRGHGDL
jgi:putative ABC transport system permease protein